MLENRSFDHMLGFLPYGGKLTGGEFNPVDPADPHSERVFVNNRAGYVSKVDPLHDLLSVNTQLFGSEDTSVDPAPMNGFVKSCIAAASGDVRTGETIMGCFDPVKLPTLSALAQEFCLCDHWFSSVPGPTWPNRFLRHADALRQPGCPGLVVGYLFRGLPGEFGLAPSMGPPRSLQAVRGVSE
jgi:phospholipase C